MVDDNVVAGDCRGKKLLQFLLTRFGGTVYAQYNQASHPPSTARMGCMFPSAAVLILIVDHIFMQPINPVDFKQPASSVPLAARTAGYAAKGHLD